MFYVSNCPPYSTDELFKSSAYLTEAYRLDPSTKYSREPTQAPFNFAFRTKKGFFGWLEEENEAVASDGTSSSSHSHNE